MTNLQAIDLLKGLEQSLDDYCELNDEGKTAFGMAITALELFGNSEQLPSAQPVDTDTNVPSNDCISRQAAIDAVYNCTDIYINNLPVMVDKADAYKALAELPSAQPERKKGKWIYNSPVTMKCNQCGLVIKDWDWHRFKYCPNCISDMRG